MNLFKKSTLAMLALALSSSLSAMEAPPTQTAFPLLSLPGDIKNLVFELFPHTVHEDQKDIRVIARNIVRLSRVNRALHSLINTPKNMICILESLPFAAHRLDMVSGQGRRSWGSTNRPQLNKMPVFYTPEMQCWITKTEGELEMGQELLDAAATKKVDRIMQLLANKKIDLNFQVGFGLTPLMEAVRARVPNSEDLAMVSLLLDAQANPDLQNNSSGNTPLMQAAWRGKSEIVALLLAKGADATLKNKKGETALDRALNHDFPYKNQNLPRQLHRPDLCESSEDEEYITPASTLLKNHNKLLLEMNKKENSDAKK